MDTHFGDAYVGHTSTHLLISLVVTFFSNSIKTSWRKITYDCNAVKTIEDMKILIRKENAKLIIAIHAYRSGRLLAGK